LITANIATQGTGKQASDREGALTNTTTVTNTTEIGSTIKRAVMAPWYFPLFFFFFLYCFYFLCYIYDYFYLFHLVRFLSLLSGIIHNPFYAKKTYANGDKLTGEWENDVIRNGPGMMVTADGSVYEGNFENGRRSGFGIAKYKYPSQSS
jgi:hypothetical protein